MDFAVILWLLLGYILWVVLMGVLVVIFLPDSALGEDKTHEDIVNILFNPAAGLILVATLLFTLSCVVVKPAILRMRKRSSALRKRLYKD